MAFVAIQLGHCYRTTGSTGTIREQEFNDLCGHEMARQLDALGHRVEIVLADPPGRNYPESDITIALHLDGHSNTTAYGCSSFHPVGQRRYDEEGARLYCDLWTARHLQPERYGSIGYNRGVNYLGSAVRDDFYAWRPDRADHDVMRSPVCVLMEHLFATNSRDYDWLWNRGGVQHCADAHVDAIGDLYGHPQPDPEEDPMARPQRIIAARKPEGGNTARHVWDGQTRLSINAADEIALRAAELVPDEPEVLWLGWETFDRIPVRSR